MRRSIWLGWLPALALALVGCRSSEPAALPDRDPALAEKLVAEEGALLIDVRTPAEHAAGAIAGSINLPVQTLRERLAEVADLAAGDQSKPIVVYCRSGRRSGIAKQILTAAGYRRVTNLGGISDWPDANR